jgi:Domain of unknown function (DUF4136)
MRQTIALVLVAAALAVTVSARVKVTTGFDPATDFSHLKVFAWPDDAPGQMKMALTKDDDPEVLRQRFEPVIISAVEQELARKGFRKAAAGEKPDFLVAYFGLVSVSTSGQTLGQFLPGSVAWGLPPFEQVATSLKIYEKGSLVLDIMTPAKQPMWRGVAQAEVHRDQPAEKRNKRLQEVIADIVGKFPPKKKS